MAVLLITYDLRDKDYEGNVLKFIRGFDSVQVTESCYAVETSETAESVVASLLKLTAKKIKVFAIGITLPWYGLGDQDTYDWLRKHLAS